MSTPVDCVGRPIKEGDNVAWMDGRNFAFEVKEVSAIKNSIKMVCELELPLDPKAPATIMPVLRCITADEVKRADA